MNVQKVITAALMMAGDPPGGNCEKTKQRPEKIGRLGLIVFGEPILDAKDLHAIDRFLARHVRVSAQGYDFDVIAAPGESFRITNNAIVTLVERVSDHANTPCS